MATLKDISNALGLSPATVSRALNGFPEVSAKTRARVEEAARKMNYRPNQIARTLVTGRSGMVGFILKSPQDMVADPAFSVVVTGLSRYLAERDIDLVFQMAVDDDEVAPYRRLRAKNTLDGFFINAPEIGDKRIAYLERHNIPFVVHGCAQTGAHYAYYDIDNYEVAASAARLLHDLGHRRIALLNGPQAYAYATARARGFTETLAARGVAIPERFISHARTGEHYGYTTALAMLAGGMGAAPTAFICASTPVAHGVMRAIADRGLSVPNDVSVIAHDDVLPEMRAINFTPALTVTRRPLSEACAPLADIMLALLNGQTPSSALRRTDAAELIIRQSTGPAPKGGANAWT